MLILDQFTLSSPPTTDFASELMRASNAC